MCCCYSPVRGGSWLSKRVDSGQWCPVLLLSSCSLFNRILYVSLPSTPAATSCYSALRFFCSRGSLSHCRGTTGTPLTNEGLAPLPPPQLTRISSPTRFLNSLAILLVPSNCLPCVGKSSIFRQWFGPPPFPSLRRSGVAPIPSPPGALLPTPSRATRPPTHPMFSLTIASLGRAAVCVHPPLGYCWLYCLPACSLVVAVVLAPDLWLLLLTWPGCVHRWP